MSFSGDVKEFAIKVNSANEKIIRGTVIAFYGDIIKASPVDSGRFRANWFVDGLNPSTRVTDKTDKNGSATTIRVTNEVLNKRDFTAFTMTNNLPYSEVIEFGQYPSPVKQGSRVSEKGEPAKFEVKSQGGFSKQAPSGVVRVNATRFTMLLEKEASKAGYGSI